MTASNYPGLKHAKPRAKALEDYEQAREDRQHERKVYAIVDVRDKKQCTCCGRRGNPYARGILGRLHHDHLVERSGLGPTETWNIALLCWICHPFKTANQLHPKGNPDRGTLRWNVEPKAAAVIFNRRRLPAHVRILKEPDE